MDPAEDVVVVRRKPGRVHDDVVERLEVADGKGWRLPRRGEVGPSREVPLDFDPGGRTHRWVRVSR